MWSEIKEMLDNTLPAEARQRVERRLALSRLLTLPKPPKDEPPAPRPPVVVASADPDPAVMTMLNASAPSEPGEGLQTPSLEDLFKRRLDAETRPIVTQGGCHAEPTPEEIEEYRQNIIDRVTFAKSLKEE